MFGINTIHLSDLDNEKHTFICQMLRNFNISHVSLNTKNKSVSICLSVDRNNEFKIARVQRLLKHVCSDQNIQVSKNPLRSSPNIIYAITINNTKTDEYAK